MFGVFWQALFRGSFINETILVNVARKGSELIIKPSPGNISILWSSYNMARYEEIKNELVGNRFEMVDDKILGVNRESPSRSINS